MRHFECNVRGTPRLYRVYRQGDSVKKKLAWRFAQIAPYDGDGILRQGRHGIDDRDHGVQRQIEEQAAS